MRLTWFSAGLAAAAFLIGVPVVGHAQAVKTDAQTWPQTIPCDVLKGDADGSYPATMPLAGYRAPHGGTQAQSAHQIWSVDQKCNPAAK
ncbi:MAG: hypothetical protein JO008_07825 [Alphaproteobacteria bacterium]|nr:hypothetical protein [Alphaproteobacteria bacterium]MBV9965589.1 hypothetical protein [Alphaproteobacteria bacterium]